jgi:hypothetical protein
MGLDTHMIAGSRACSTSTRPTNPTITNKTSPHYDEALAELGSLPPCCSGNVPSLRTEPLGSKASGENNDTGQSVADLAEQRGCLFTQQRPQVRAGHAYQHTRRGRGPLVLAAISRLPAGRMQQHC